MEKLIVVLLSLLLSTNQAFAIVGAAVVECNQPVTALKGQQPFFPDCDGYFFTDAAEKQAAEARDDAASLKLINEKLNLKSKAQTEENEILERRLNLYIQQADVLSKDVARRDNSESLYRFGYFILGVVVTGYIASNVRP